MLKSLILIYLTILPALAFCSMPYWELVTQINAKNKKETYQEKYDRQYKEQHPKAKEKDAYESRSLTEEEFDRMEKENNSSNNSNNKKKQEKRK